MVRKKIAIITPLLSKGGLERVAANLSNFLSKYFDVYMIVFNASRIDYSFKGRLINFNIDLLDRNPLKRIYNTSRVIERLSRIKKKENFDVSISMGEISNIPNVLSGGECILTVHENRFNASNDLQRKLVNFSLKYLYSRENILSIVTVSEDIKDRLESYLGLKENKIVTIYNPFDIERIRKMSLENIEEPFNKVFSNFRVLVNVGRLAYPKGHWFLIRIFRDLKLRGLSDLKLVIIGDGELRQSLISLSEKLGLRTYSVWNMEKKYSMEENDVYFLGFQKNPFKFLKRAYAFLSTSLWEGLPNVIVEALACENVVIYSNCRSGPLEILAPTFYSNYGYVCLNKKILGDYGILLPPLEKKFVTNVNLTQRELYWSKELFHFLKNDSFMVKYKERALRRAYDFSLEKIGEEWLKLINKN